MSKSIPRDAAITKDAHNDLLLVIDREMECSRLTVIVQLESLIRITQLSNDSDAFAKKARARPPLPRVCGQDLIQS